MGTADRLLARARLCSLGFVVTPLVARLLQGIDVPAALYEEIVAVRNPAAAAAARWPGHDFISNLSSVSQSCLSSDTLEYSGLHSATNI